MACLKLGSKADAFQRQGQAWYVPLSFFMFFQLQFFVIVIFSL
jgi:hypothetical protein